MLKIMIPEAFDDVIKDLERRKADIDNVLKAMVQWRALLRNLPPDLQNEVMEKFNQGRKHFSLKRNTNYAKVVEYLKSQRTPQTVAQIMAATKIPKGSLLQVLYNKRHRGVFISERVGKGKLQGWKLSDIETLLGAERAPARNVAT